MALLPCPAPDCGHMNNRGAERCERCGADLRALGAVQGAADRAFNRGVEAVGQEHWGQALACFEMTLMLRPDDLEAMKAAAACQAHLGRMGDSLRQWRAVYEKCADDEQAAKIISALEAAAEPSPETEAHIRLLLGMPPTED